MFVLGENVHIVFDIIYWSICPKCFNLQQSGEKSWPCTNGERERGGFNSTNKKTTKSTHFKKKELNYKRWLFKDFVLCNITYRQSTPCGIYSKVYSHRNLIVSPFIKFINAFKGKQASSIYLVSLISKTPVISSGFTSLRKVIAIRTRRHSCSIQHNQVNYPKNHNYDMQVLKPLADASKYVYWSSQISFKGDPPPLFTLITQ